MPTFASFSRNESPLANKTSSAVVYNKTMKLVYVKDVEASGESSAISQNWWSENDTNRRLPTCRDSFLIPLASAPKERKKRSFPLVFTLICHILIHSHQLWY
jgi:hypothetical protein